MERKYHAIVEISEELYHWLCSNSMERGLKNPQEKPETLVRIYQWEQAFRNSSWEHTK